MSTQKEASSVEDTEARSAMKLALEALKKADALCPVGCNEEIYVRDAIYAITEALAKQEQRSDSEHTGEPVAWWIPKAEQFCLQNPSGERPFAKAWEPLYTTPQQSKVDKHTDDLCQVLIQKTHIQERQIAELQAQLVAQPKQEPVAYMWPTMDSFTSAEDVGSIPNWTDYYTVPLYTAPQQRKPLTDEQENKAAMKLAECMDYPWTLMPKEGKQKMRAYAKEIIEAAHGIKEQA